MITNYTYGAINQDVQFANPWGFPNWSVVQVIAAPNPDIVNFTLYIDQARGINLNINQAESMTNYINRTSTITLER